MPKQTTASKKQTQSEQQTAKPVVVEQQTAQPVVAKKAKKTKEAVVKSKTEPVVEVKAEPVVAEVKDEVNEVVAQKVDLMSKFQQVSSILSTIKTELRTMEKKHTRELKAVRKLASKRKQKSGNRAPSGFVKPTAISDELASFLEKPFGSEMARTEVTSELNNYINAKSLKDPSNGRKINPDAKLSALLKIKEEDKVELTYFNLQRYMSHHFAKANAPLNPPPSAPVATA
jgi:upstream activation factor subunit UAF30